MKKILTIFCFIILTSVNVFAKDLTIDLNFPVTGRTKAAAPKPILKPQEVSGNIILDITPYPEPKEENRYLVEYFLDGQLIYETKGFDNPENFSFKYNFETEKYKNGIYKLIVNFWDEKGTPGIGIRKIKIKNKTE